MTNTFATWQPVFAAAGIPLLPAIDKRPPLKGPAKFGVPASTKLIPRTRRIAPTTTSDAGYPHCCAQQENTVSQAHYTAKITPARGTSAIDVTVPANDPFQARRLIEQLYGPVQAWWLGPNRT